MKRLLLTVLLCLTAAARGADYVITISVDGMGSSYMEESMKSGGLPAIRQLISEGAGTMNAHCDSGISVTLPNHTTMLTSRPVVEDCGHNWNKNTDSEKGTSLHSNKKAYIASAFDVAHDHGLATGLWATKSKFSLFDTSYDAMNGSNDAVAPDNGRDKLDVFSIAKSSIKNTEAFIRHMTTNPCHYAFIHLGDADGAGHKHGWGSKEYQVSLTVQDECVRRIMDIASEHPALKGRTTLILTADHGGREKGHSDKSDPLIYTIPFYVWGHGVSTGNLYTFNVHVRTDPGNKRPEYSDALQPIRNGDAGNLALSLLGLGPIPNSSINAKQDLRVSPPQTQLPTNRY